MGEVIPKLRASARATVILTCAKCGNSFDRGYRISATRASHKQFCSKACQIQVYARPDKACEECGALFRPRSATKTKFCSQACNTRRLRAIWSEETQAKALAGMRKAEAEGRNPRLIGEDNPLWKGGREAYRARWQASGKAAATLRAYRKANPDKVREFSVRRKGRKLDKLPYGTLPAIRKAQGNKCAICARSLKSGSHLDHITPLAKGGKHEPRNIQFLCAPCNLAKSDRDPIVHMQSLGMLL